LKAFPKWKVFFVYGMGINGEMKSIKSQRQIANREEGKRANKKSDTRYQMPDGDKSQKEPIKRINIIKQTK